MENWRLLEESTGRPTLLGAGEQPKVGTTPEVPKSWSRSERSPAEVQWRQWSLAPVQTGPREEVRRSSCCCQSPGPVEQSQVQFHAKLDI